MPDIPPLLSPDIQAYRHLVSKLYLSEKKLGRAQDQLRQNETALSPSFSPGGAGGGGPQRLAFPASPGPSPIRMSDRLLEKAGATSPFRENAGGAPSLSDFTFASPSRAPGAGAGSPRGSPRDSPENGAAFTAKHWRTKYFAAEHRCRKAQRHAAALEEDLMVLSLQIEKLKGRKAGGAPLEVKLNKDLIASKLALLVAAAQSAVDQLVSERKAQVNLSTKYGKLQKLHAQIGILGDSVQALIASCDPPSPAKSLLREVAFSPKSRASFPSSPGPGLRRELRESAKKKREEEAAAEGAAGRPRPKGADTFSFTPRRKLVMERGPAEERPVDLPAGPGSVDSYKSAEEGSPPGRSLAEIEREGLDFKAKLKAISQWAEGAPAAPSKGASPGRSPGRSAGSPGQSAGSPGRRTRGRLVEYFRAADKDGDGILSRAELGAVLKELGLSALAANLASLDPVLVSEQVTYAELVHLLQHSGMSSRYALTP